MTQPRLPHNVTRYLNAVLAVLMIAAGGLLIVRAMSNRPSQLRLEEPDSLTLSTAKTVVQSTAVQSAAVQSAAVQSTAVQSTVAQSTVQTHTLRSTQSISPTRTNVGTPAIAPATLFTITAALSDGLPLGVLAALTPALPAQTQMISVAYDAPTATVRFGWDGALGTPIYTQTFAAASRFDTINLVIGWSDLKQMWQGTTLTYSSIALISNTLPALQQILGPPGGLIEAHETISGVVDSAWDDRSTLVLIPFDQLVPRLTVLAIDGQNPVENAAFFDATRYPLTATLFVEQNPFDQNPSAQNPGDQIPGTLGKDAQLIDQWLRRLPTRNRNATQLTVIAATGVTAMARMMGAQMDELGSEWPATEVGPTLAAADLTIFSNEVSFAPDCETSANPDTLVFCSKPAYWKTLELSGIDLLNLTGNHVNDWGRDSFVWSLDFYRQKGIPYYGGGATNQTAVQPIFVEHNGNRLAFLGANSIGPPMAWASDSLPGAARFDFGEAAALIEQIRTEDKATVIFYDIQYTESYGVSPLIDQRNTFNTLLRYGADVVTGVQAHVPQALEFTEGKLILFGLGNLYFDQMWGEATRQGLIAKHTIYEGRHLSTQILVTVLYEYGQPRWATSEQREEILQRVFVASYW